MSGDWGNVCPGDAEANDEALRHGARLLASYTTSQGVRFWVITEAGRKHRNAVNEIRD